MSDLCAEREAEDIEGAVAASIFAEASRRLRAQKGSGS